VVLLNCLGKLGKLQLLQFTQLEVIGCPVVNAAAWGDNLENFNKPIPFEMTDGATGRDRHLMPWAIATVVWVRMAIALESS